jgi:sortase A
MTAIWHGRRRMARPAQLWPLVKPRTSPAVPVPDNLSIISTSMTVLAIVCAWFVAQLLLFGGLEQARSQDRLYDEFREQLATATAPIGGIIVPGAPVALLEAPSLGWEQVVTEGTSSGVLLRGPGHRRDTVLPGQAGVSILYGKSGTYGKPFKAMLSGAAGAKMTVTTGQGTLTYTIGQVRRAGDPMPVAPAAGGSRITMVTADGAGRLGSLAPDKVVFIDATLDSGAFTAPGGRLNAIGPAETAMASDTSVMPSLALSLGVLAVATGGAIVARRRFGAVRTWLIGAPVIVALAWTTADLATYLLPNLL